MVLISDRGLVGPVICCILIAGVIACAATADTLPKPFEVIPQPRHVELLGGKGLDFGQLKCLQLKGDLSRPVMGPMLSHLPETQQSGKRVLSLELVSDDSVPESPEGYVLTISKHRGSITSRGETGLFYGCQTLEQLLEDARDTGTPIPACIITDFPAFTYRAVHFDVKHHLDSVNYYYDSIDRLARYKINAIIFEVEDKLRYRRQPLVGAPHAISIEEMATLTNYARERHIEISPLVQGLGHATFILKHPEYAHLRENPNSSWCFCPLDERGYEVLFDLYLDAMEATPGSRYLHVGGDEIGEIGLCPRCKPTADRDGMLALNLFWLNRVCDFVTEHGRTPIFWDDMPFVHSGLYESVHRHKSDEEATAKAWEKGQPILDGLLDRFPKNCVYMRWDYSMARQPGNVRALDWYRERNLKVMIATASQALSALMPRASVTPRIHTSEFYDDRVETIRSFVQLAAEKGIDGHLSTAWDDCSPHMETYWRSLIASAEYGWYPNGRSLADYETAYLHRQFGPECTNATQLYPELFKAIEFWLWALFVDNASRTRTLPPEKERKLMDLPELTSPGTWSGRHEERLAVAKQEIVRYKELAGQLADLSVKARRGRYHLELLTAINEFQIMPARLLLALEQCDTTDTKQRKAGMADVGAALDAFDEAWANLQRVYSKTRFLPCPEGFVEATFTNVWPDKPHFAAQRNDLSYLVMPEERYHKLLRKWMEAAEAL